MALPHSWSSQSSPRPRVHPSTQSSKFIRGRQALAWTGFIVMKSDGISFNLQWCRLGKIQQDILGWRQHTTDQIYKSKYVLLWWFQFIIPLFEKAYKHNSKTKTLFYEFLVLICYISFNMHLLSITLNILNLHIKVPKIFVFHIFGLKCCLHPYIQS